MKINNELTIEEQICVNKEWAEKLKEVGYPQRDSVFYWAIGGDKCENEWSLLYSDDEGWSSTDIIAAPIASELLERLPSSIDIGHFLIRKHSWGYSINIIEHMSLESNHEEQGKSLANALTKMLIWLVKNEYINFKD